VVFRRLPVPLMDRLWPVIQKTAVGDLSDYGLPLPPPGAYSKYLRDDVTPILDVGLVPLLKHGQVEFVAAVQGFDGADVLLADGTRIQPDAVIAGTGFREQRRIRTHLAYTSSATRTRSAACSARSRSTRGGSHRPSPMAPKT
jgi:putative flavoprotein involved in K+ transport